MKSNEYQGAGPQRTMKTPSPSRGGKGGDGVTRAFSDEGGFDVQEHNYSMRTAE